MFYLIFIGIILSSWFLLENKYPDSFIGNDTKTINNILDYIIGIAFIFLFIFIINSLL